MSRLHERGDVQQRHTPIGRINCSFNVAPCLGNEARFASLDDERRRRDAKGHTSVYALALFYSDAQEAFGK